MKWLDKYPEKRKFRPLFKKNPKNIRYLPLHSYTVLLVYQLLTNSDVFYPFFCHVFISIYASDYFVIISKLFALDSFIHANAWNEWGLCIHIVFKWKLKDIFCGWAPESHVMFFLMLVSMCFLWQIMCKVVTMLGKDTVEHLLLPRFCDLCSDARLFQVRKVPSLPVRDYYLLYMYKMLCFLQQQLGQQSLSNWSLNLFSLRINSLTEHVSHNSVTHITLAHSALLSSWGILIPCN